MLKGLEDKFSKILNKLGKKNKLNDRNVNDGIREIKLAFLRLMLTIRLSVILWASLKMKHWAKRL